MAKKPAEKPAEKPTVFHPGRIYSVTDQVGVEHRTVCLDVTKDSRGKVYGMFHLRGFIPEDVEQGTERANMFKLLE